MKMINRFFLVIAVIALASCAKLSIKDGLQAYEELRYSDAITHLANGLTKVENGSARRALADAYLETNRYAEAAEMYSMLAEDPANSDEDRINYGRALMATGNYDGAEEVFSGILSRDPSNQIAQSLKSSCRRINEFTNDSSRFEVKLLPISGLDAVYAPFAFGSGIYFSGERSGTGEKDQYTGLKFTDLYFAQVTDGQISTFSAVEGVNEKYHDGAAIVSADQQVMILTRSNYDGQKRLGSNAENTNMTQLYVASKDANGQWTDPQLMPFCDENFMFAHPALSDDGKTLYFASDMAGGQGGMDLYKTTLENNVWTKPLNLGAEINTSGNELFPSLRSNDSLYFASNARQTLGGLDILYSVNQDGRWTGPFHLSYPMNTPADDFGITFTGDGSAGFFSSNRGGADCIYSFVINEAEFTLNGIVTSKTSGDPLGETLVTIINITDGTEDQVMTDEVGMFDINLLPGKDYRIRAEKEGYFSVNEEVSTKNKTQSEDIVLNLELLELSNPEGVVDNGTNDGDGDSSGPTDNLPLGVNPNAPYKIPNILWDYNKWDVREDAKPYLDYVAKLLKDNPSLKVEISSHCDSRGGEAFNVGLSDKRADAVVEYLVSKGVRRAMMISKGYGENRPVNECTNNVPCTEDQHQENRRTEFVVIE